MTINRRLHGRAYDPHLALTISTAAVDGVGFAAVNGLARSRASGHWRLESWFGYRRFGLSQSTTDARATRRQPGRRRGEVLGGDSPSLDGQRCEVLLTVGDFWGRPIWSVSNQLGQG